MSRPRLPWIPTLLVAAAVLLMVRLGLWQLDRRHEKEALVARAAANRDLPPAAFAALWPVREEALFRRASVTCIAAEGWRAAAGRTAAGEVGWRHLARCRTGAEGPGLWVDVGTSRASQPPAWRGGTVRGRVTWAPDEEPLVARLFRPPPAREPLIVAETPAPGLQPSAQPDPAAIPNNHLSYAVQWFAFAATAVIVYGVVLWRRGRGAARPPA